MRCFVGFDIICHFPELPSLQLIAPQSRHLTLAFLGNRTPDKIEALIEQMPKPTFKVASSPSLTVNSTLSFELTSNTNLTVYARGTDGVTRSANITLGPP